MILYLGEILEERKERKREQYRFKNFIRSNKQTPRESISPLSRIGETNQKVEKVQ